MTPAIAPTAIPALARVERPELELVLKDVLVMRMESENWGELWKPLIGAESLNCLVAESWQRRMHQMTKMLMYVRWFLN